MGTFKFRCVFCRQKIEADDEWDGMFAQCPNCGRQIEIRRDDEFAVKPPHTRLAPEKPPEKKAPAPALSHPAFQKPFPPKMPRVTAPKSIPEGKSRLIPEAETAPMEKPRFAAETEKPPEEPASRTSAAPKPFPRPFSVNPPGKDDPKK